MERNSQENNHITVMFSTKMCMLDNSSFEHFSDQVIINTQAKINLSNQMPCHSCNRHDVAERASQKSFPSNHNRNLTVTERSKAIYKIQP